MQSILAPRRISSVILLVLLLVPAILHARPAPRAEQRARQLAARRYVGMPVSLPVSALANGLRTCARDAPTGMLGFWKVPPKAMDAIDAELMKHMRSSGLGDRLPYSPSLYLRQYVGVVRDGVRFVYVNALLVEKGSPMVETAKKSFPSSCSSVSGYWGISYDAKSKQFAGFGK